MTLRRPSLATVCAALCAATLLAACSQQSANPAPEAETATATVHPESGLEVIPVTVTSSNGEHVFAAEVAATDREQAMGLMFRTAMGADEGMIFPYDPPEPLSFWMRNTVLPLDIVFIGPDHRILNVGEGIPYNEVSVHSSGPAIAVLELNGGRSAELGIGPGDLVEW
ncbi:MAG: DUF192 domain-containing protein [Erythrobacter sp.]|nr:DUF192 domain-containing protein [Erythrobacter sp.]